MYRASYSGFLLSTLCLFATLSPNASADHGTVVSGSVIAIDPLNQIMRVYVTGVNGQALYGSPETNYVDYLVSPNTVVLGSNNQLVSQSSVLVGSQIQMQFAGPLATTIVLYGNYSNGGFVTYAPLNQNLVSTFVQSYSPILNYSSGGRLVSQQIHVHRPASSLVVHSRPVVHRVQHISHPHPAMHATPGHVGLATHAHSVTHPR
jgi:hypothetical protein